MKPVILVTAIGTITSTTIVRELKKTGAYHLIGADINERDAIATALDVEEYHTFPLATTNDYLPFILEFCEEHRVDYYYASIDREVALLSGHRDRFEAIGTKLCIPNASLVELCHYKNRFAAWIGERFPAIAIRSYERMEDALNAHFPLFVKPVEGVASSGCRRIDDAEMLKASVRQEQIGTELLVQDCVEGDVITVDCLRNKSTGQKTQIQRRELLRNANGCGIAVEIIEKEDLKTICDDLMEALDLNGMINMEFFETGDGYRIIEINPRFSAGSVFSCMAGVNTVLNALRIADGLPCEFGEAAIGARFAERYEAYRMDGK